MYRVCTYFFYINIKKEGKNKKERTLNTNVKKNVPEMWFMIYLGRVLIILLMSIRDVLDMYIFLYIYIYKKGAKN
jgi:hypothetical protein